jgi:MarR family transcriptional regulator, organic hydroperoxide resistance regulator
MPGTAITTLTPSGHGAPDTEHGEINPLALERQVCFALAVASRSVIGVYRPVLERLGLTHPQYLVMLALWEQSPLSVSDVGRLLQLDLATASPLLKRLEALGLVDRRRDPSDERVLRVSLTEAGRELRNEALDVPFTVMERLDLTLEDVQSLHAALTPLIAKTRAVRDATADPR